MIKRIVLFLLTISFLISVGKTGDTKVLGEEEKLLVVGTGAFKDGFYDIAEKELSQFIKDYPSHPNLYEAYYLLGKTLLIKGKWKEAQSAFLKIVNEKKNFEQLDYVLLWLAITELKTEAPGRAKRFLLELFKISPKFEWLDYVYYLLGLIEFGSGNLSSSEQYFKKASLLSKRKEILWHSNFWLGILSIRLNNFETASEYFNRVLKERKGLPYLLHKYTLYWLAEAQLKSGQWEEAKKSYQIFTNLFRNDSLSHEAFWKIGFCHYRLGERREALDLFQSFKNQYRYSPLLPYTQFLIGRIYLSQGDYSSSLKEFEPILAKPSDNPLWSLSLLSTFWIHAYQGNVEGLSKISQRLQKISSFEEEKVFLQWIQGEMTFAEGKIPEALPYYFNVLNTRFREKALFQIGKGYFLENKFRDAITNFDILFLEYPNSKYKEEALFLKGESHLQIGNINSALECYEHLLKYGTKSPWQLFATTQMGTILLLLEENQKAEGMFKRILQDFPEHPLTYYALFKLGNLHFRKNNVVEAIHYYSQILKGSRFELRGEAYFLLGEIFYQQGKYDKAFGNFETAVRYLKETSPLFFLTYIEMGNLQRKLGNFEEAKRSYTTVLNQAKDEELKKAAYELLHLIEKR